VSDKGRWSVDAFFLAFNDKTSGIVSQTFYNNNGLQFTLPQGAWRIDAMLDSTVVGTGSAYLNSRVSISTSTSVRDPQLVAQSNSLSSTQNERSFKGYATKTVFYTAPTTLYLLMSASFASGSLTLLRTQDCYISSTPQGL